MDTWTEIIYDDRGYRLLPAKHPPGRRQAGTYCLQDREGETLLHIQEGAFLQAELCRTLPLPLFVMALMQTLTQAPQRNTRKDEPK